MENLKLFVFDIDGTLLKAGSKTIEASTAKAIQLLKEKGHQVLVATGRNLPFIKPTVKETLKSDYLVCANGHCVLDKDYSIVTETHLNADDVMKLLEFAREHHLPVGSKTAHKLVVLNEFDAFRKAYSAGPEQDNLFANAETEEQLKETLAQTCSLFMYDFDDKFNLSTLFPMFSFKPAGTHGYDVFTTHTDKTHGIQAVLDRLNLGWENVCAFGDMDNDIEMLEKAQLGIAMGNGSDTTKQAADYVTDPVGEDGIYNALKHFGII